MSNAEKILNEISDLHYDDWQKEDILKAMQAHTNKALSELEEQVQGLNIEELSQMGRAGAGTIQEIVLELITKAKNNE